MPITNREAYDMKQEGHTVIVVCGVCGERVWTGDAVYDEGNDVWECRDCHTKGGKADAS